jgi:hypothetical protein
MARFPAIEAEPAPPSLGRRVLRRARTLGVVAAVVATVAVSPSALRRVGHAEQSSPRPDAATAPTGRVVVVDGLHLSTTDSRGRSPKPLTGDLRMDPASLTLAVDPAGRTAVTGPGIGWGATALQQRVELDAPMTPPVPAAPRHLVQNGGLPDEPWAAKGEALVVVTGARLDQVSLLDVASGRSTPLGAGVAAAAVPDARAVVVGAGGRPVVREAGAPPLATARRVELREVGSRPVVLSTDVQLARAGRLPVGQPIVLDRISVSPDGRHVLVAFDLAGTHEYPNGFFGPPRVRPAGAQVVLDRTGHVEAVRQSLPGRGLEWARWSDADTLALGETAVTETLNTPDRILTFWDRRSAPRSIALPGSLDNTLLTPCVWSPSSDHLLCGDDRGWFDVRPAAAKVERVAGVTGRPLVWLP